MNILRVLASVRIKVCVVVVLLIIVTLREISFHPSQQKPEDILMRNYSHTAQPPRKQRTSTEYTILGKRLHSLYKMSSYKPGQNSPPLQHAVKTILNIMNQELSASAPQTGDKANSIRPEFHPANARDMKFVRFVLFIDFWLLTSLMQPLVLTIIL